MASYDYSQSSDYLERRTRLELDAIVYDLKKFVDKYGGGPATIPSEEGMQGWVSWFQKSAARYCAVHKEWVAIATNEDADPY